MTLLELMLVLALLVMIGAMAYPSLRVPFQMQTLRKGGEVVRVEWNRARNKAMRSGQIQMFSFEPESGTYHVQPYYTEQDALEGNLMSASTLPGGTATMPLPQSSESTTSQPQQLPEGVVFGTVEVETDLRALQLQQENQAAMMGMNNMPLDQQVPPILFYPDGTTSDARVVLTNEYQRLYVVISMRSLTGVVKVSELVTADEIPTVP
jgi:Tfp pilus assembly protein FimT